ncbi:hypothetical protein [Mycobacterium sp. Marseille-P9652]|uniref:hypothetical protein n=1 Tax=Mycobacterium sp. Marseille-P9652 TaxID=2654950 RepID=UPI0012E86A5C|nr:hypothetical protein [Mycobacterium sp. Marseille-P9652]
MKQALLRAVALLVWWTIGLLVAARVVPNVSVSVAGVVAAVVLFSLAQAGLSLWIVKLPHAYASLLLGAVGLALTLAALIVSSGITHGINIAGVESWIATTVLVWLITTIGAISLPDVLDRDPARLDVT